VTAPENDTGAPPHGDGTCGMFVIDGDDVRKCDEPAATTRTVGRIVFVMCERCAAAFDLCVGGGL
jgi:hypothetical protein